jgi:ectoine hydroxylase-related dioxygenase (phytanoyl-CoA dioxygenase family)
VAEVRREGEGLTEANSKFWVVPTSDGGGFQVSTIFEPFAHHPAFRELVFHPGIVDCVERLIGPDIQLHHTMLNLKPRSEFTQFEWHQDYAFLPHTNFDLLAVMIHLDDSTPANGCLTVIPGSHRWGPVQHVYPSEYGASWRLADESVLADRTRWLDLPVPAGGMELHHCNMLHSSRPNLTDQPRTAMVIWYRAADNLQLAGVTDHHGQGLQVRGSNPGVVRMVEGTFHLPPGES